MFKLPDLRKPGLQNDQPLYMLLYNDIKNSIITGDLKQNEKLPSKRKLSVQLGISVKSVENAYDQLLLEGFIYSIEKKGYFVSAIADYMAESVINTPEETTKYEQTKYYVNLRANRSMLEDFPADTWCRLMRETLSEDPMKIFRLVPFNGVFKLRKAIANHLRSFRGMEVSPDQIIISAGTEYMYSRLIQMLGPDTIYALPDPSSKRLHELYETNRLKYSVISSHDGLDIAKLSKEKCQVLHISPAHQYPLGKVMPIQERLEILKWAHEDPNRYIIEDDFDSEYVLAGRPIPPLYSIDSNDKVIYMNTFSKSVSPAVRISYMVLPEALMNRYLKTISFYACTVASVEQFTLAKFIEKKHFERSIHRTNRQNTRLKPLIVNELEQMQNEGLLTYNADCVGSLILVHLKTDKSDFEIKKLFRENSIITSMLSEYYHDPQLQLRHMHIMVVNYIGVNEEQMRYLHKVLKNIL